MRILLLTIICIFACMRAEAASLEDCGSPSNQFTKHLAKVDRLIGGSSVEGPIAPASIVYVFDVHGTLTNKESPTMKGVELPRQETINFLRELHRKGVTVILSSAWDKPADIIKSINNCGLQDFLGASSQESLVLSMPSVFGSAEFKVWRFGNVASVKCLEDFSDPYFRQKALAPLFIKDDLPAVIKHLCLVEDSPGNIKIFDRDVLRYAPAIFGPDKPVSFESLLLRPAQVPPVGLFSGWCR